MDLDNFIRKNREKLIKIDWNDTIDYQNKCLSLSKTLLEELEKEEYFEPLKDFFKSIGGDIKKYQEDIVGATYQIAVVGAIKAGKSTLINTLIGYELASTDVTPETATLTKFRGVEKNSANNKLKVKFYTTAEWNEIWKNAKEKRAEAFLEEYEELKAETVKVEYLDKEELEESFSSIEEIKKAIRKWTSSKEKEHYFVKELEIGLKDLDIPSEICLVDTPGLNDIIDYRSKITRDYIDSANAVIVCVNSKTLRNEEMLTIAKVFSKARYKKDKIYILGTQIDTMNSIDDWEIQKNAWINKYLHKREYFETKENADRQVIGISSQLYNSAMNFKNKGKIDKVSLLEIKLIPKEKRDEWLEKNFTETEIEDIVNKLIEISNIEQVREIIKGKLLKNYQESLEKDFIEKYKIITGEIEKFRKEHQEIIINKKKDLEKTSDELKQKIEEEKEKIKKFEEIRNTLETKVEEITKKFNNEFKELNNNFKNLEKGIKNINIE